MAKQGHETVPNGLGAGLTSTGSIAKDRIMQGTPWHVPVLQQGQTPSHRHFRNFWRQMKSIQDTRKPLHRNYSAEGSPCSLHQDDRQIKLTKLFN